MTLLPSLPKTDAKVVTAAGLAATEWYDFFRLLRTFVNDNSSVAADLDALIARVAALEEAASDDPAFRGVASVRVTVSDSLVQFFLDGDEAEPGAREVYGTDDDGRKGWTPVLVDRLDGASYSTLQHFINTMASPGIITGCDLSQLDVDTVQISAGTGMVRIADDDVSSLAFFDIPAATFDIPADQETRFYGVVYSGGAVGYEARLVDDWDKDTEIPLGSAVRFNGTMVVTPNKYRTGDPITNVIQRFYANLPASRDNSVGGLALGETGTRNVTLSAGRIWSRLSDFDVASKDSSTDAMVSVYFNGTNLTFTSGITQWDNLQYNDLGTGALVTMGNNKYASLWFFLSIDGSQYGFAYGTAEYNTLGEAADEGIPPYLTQDFFNQSLLVGRFLFQKSAATASRIESAFLTPFSSTAINDHNSLGGLQGGTVGEFYHLTAAQNTFISGLTNTDGLPEGASNLYYTDERVDDRVAALIVDSASVTWAYDDTAGTLTATATGTPGGGTKAQFLRGDNTWAMELVTASNPGFQGVKYSNDAAGFQFRFIKYRGTESVPAAAQTNDVLMPFQARAGLDTAGVISESGNVGAYLIKAAQNFTNTGQGTYGVLQSVPVGSTTLADQYLWNDVAFTPATTGVPTLGSSSLRWGTVYGGSLNVTTAVAATMGGTGQSSYAVGDLLYASTTTALSKLAAGTNGHVLTLAGGLPSWAASTGLTNFTEAVSTAAPNTITPVVSLTATNAAVNVDAAFIPKGAGAILAAVPNNAASGGNKRGDRAVDFQRSRTTAAQVASGNDSGIACGVDNTASLTNAFVGGGNGNTASGSSSATLGGTSGTASGLRSAIVGGSSNTASGAASVAHGTQANTKSIENARAHGVVTGKQALEVPLFAQTTNATPTTLRSNSGSAAATNQFALSSGSAAMVRVRVVARQSAGTGTVGACAGWDTNVLIKNIGGTTSLVGTPSVAQAFGDASASTWTIAITADDANDALKIEVTGEASKTIQWTAHVIGAEA